MSKYLHDYNKGKCKACGKTGQFGTDAETGELIQITELKMCTSCTSVQYCCKECQKEDWPDHKYFCKRFRKLIAEYKKARDSRPPGSARPVKPSSFPLCDFIENADWRGLLQHVTFDHPTCDVNDGGGNMNPLLLACGQGQIECAQILIDRGANINDECKVGNLTPLQYASWWGHDDIVQMLLNQGADVNTSNTHQTFPLGFAAQYLHTDIVQLLIRYGANVEQRNTMGWTPIMNTICMGSTLQAGNDDNRNDLQVQMEDNPKIFEIVKMLVDAGADVNARGHSGWGVTDFKGDTALNIAGGGSGHIKLVEFLISQGALLDVKRECESIANA